MKKLLLTACSLSLFFLTATAQSTNPAPYCGAAFDDMDGSINVDDHIDAVSFGTLNNASNAHYAAPHYVFYNNLAAPTFNANTAYTLKVKFTVAGGAGYGVWIDFNHNNTFDASEQVAGSTSNTATYLALGSDSIQAVIPVPAGAVNGNTRMRVRIVEDDNYHGAHGPAELACTASPTPADSMDWGETEDYTINITGGVNGTTGVEEAVAMNSISMYPNPATDAVTLLMPDHTEGYSYTIMNMLGQTIEKNTIAASRPMINIAALADGIYFMKVSNPAIHAERVMKFEKR